MWRGYEIGLNQPTIVGAVLDEQDVTVRAGPAVAAMLGAGTSLRRVLPIAIEMALRSSARRIGLTSKQEKVKARKGVRNHFHRHVLLRPPPSS